MPDDENLPDSGSLIIGENGAMVLPHYDKPRLYPVDQFKDYAIPEVEPVNHYGEWVEACLGKGKTGANFDYAGPLTETVLLGNVAVRFPGKTLDWDGAGMTVTNLPEANQFLRRTYREGWQAEGLSS